MAAEVGQSAPDFTLPDADRQPQTLSGFRGKNVVLAFYPGAFTGVCTTEMCTFRDQMEQFNSLDAQVLGISVDGAFSLKVFSDQNNLNFPLLSDFARQVVNQYDVALENFAGMGRLYRFQARRGRGGQGGGHPLPVGGSQPRRRTRLR